MDLNFNEQRQLRSDASDSGRSTSGSASPMDILVYTSLWRHLLKRSSGKKNRHPSLHAHQASARQALSSDFSQEASALPGSISFRQNCQQS